VNEKIHKHKPSKLDSLTRKAVLSLFDIYLFDFGFAKKEKKIQNKKGMCFLAKPTKN
jgi:hypothetical protein